MVDVNGGALFEIVTVGTFESKWRLLQGLGGSFESEIVPPGVSGMAITFRVFAPSWFSGRTVQSNDVVVTFQYLLRVIRRYATVRWCDSPVAGWPRRSWQGARILGNLHGFRIRSTKPRAARAVEM